MKKDQIKVGGYYVARVSGNFVIVRVDCIRTRFGFSGHQETVFDITNISTKRTTTFRSAAKFRGEACTTCWKPFCRTPGQCAPATPAEVGTNEHNKREVERLIGAPTQEVEGEACPFAAPSLPASATPSSADPPAKQEDEQSSDPSESGVAATTPTAQTASEAESTLQVEVSLAEAAAAGNEFGRSRLAARIAAAQAAPAPASDGPKLTDEQVAIIETARKLQAAMRRQGVDSELRQVDGQWVLVIGAGAGTGKTFTLQQLEQVLTGMGQYTAFNSELVDNSKIKFKRASCKTTHGLAFGAEGRRFQHRLKAPRVKSYQVAQMLGIDDVWLPSGEPYPKGSPEWKEAAAAAGSPLPPDFAPRPMKRLKASYLAGQVIIAIKRFCQSADPVLEKKHFRFDGLDTTDKDGKRDWSNTNRLQAHLLPFAQRAWEDLCREDGKLQFFHDVYVKIWQLSARPVIAADYILLDEAQDTAEVMLDVLRRQKHALLILVGDDCQQIYEWRGAVNAMAKFKGAPRRLLSQSFRFGQAVADVANSVLRLLKEPTDLVMKGLPSIPTRVCQVEEPRCCIYRTNAGAVAQLMRDFNEGKRDHLIGGTKDVIDFCKAALDLQQGRTTDHPELGCFANWDEVQEYVKEEEGQDLRLMVKLINEFGAQAIIDALKNMPSQDDAHRVLTTAHRSKGREWTSVKLGGDFRTANKMDDAEVRLLYVAGTRAQEELDISECPPFCGGWDRPPGATEGGEWIPGIEVTYTTPMPTEEELAAYRAARAARAAAAAPPAIAGPSPAPAAPTAAANGQGGQAGATAAPPPPAGTYRFVSHPAPPSNGQKWCIRGPADPNFVRGRRVMVQTRNGNKEIILYTVVRKDPDAWLYGLDA